MTLARGLLAIGAFERQEPSNMELAARRAWLSDAVDRRFGACSTCSRVLDDEGRHLLVARQRNRRVYECLDCWDEHSVQGAAR